MQTSQHMQCSTLALLCELEKRRVTKLSQGSRYQQARFIPSSPLKTQRLSHCAMVLHNGGLVDARRQTAQHVCVNVPEMSPANSQPKEETHNILPLCHIELDTGVHPPLTPAIPCPILTRKSRTHPVNHLATFPLSH